MQFLIVIVISGQDSPYAKFSRDAKRKRTDDSARAKISHLIAVPSYTLLRPIIAIYKCRIRCPGFGGLVGKLLAAMEFIDPTLDLLVDGILDNGFGLGETWSKLPDILITRMSIGAKP